MKKIITVMMAFILIIMMQQLKAQNLAAGTGILWKISGNGLQQESYFYLATQLCETKIVLDKNVLAAVGNVKTIAVESNMNSKANVVKLPQLIMAQKDSQRIKNVLSVAAYNELLKTAKEGYGMNEQMLNQFKPFYVNAFLLRGASPCESPIVERIEDVWNEYAIKNNVQYKELFTPEEVVAEYDTYPTQYWQQNILYLYNNTDQIKSLLQNKNSLYGFGNADALKSLFTSNPYYKVKYANAIATEHNQSTVAKILPLIKANASLITIDAGYFLITGNSVPELLRKMGYTITPVKL